MQPQLVVKAGSLQLVHPHLVVIAGSLQLLLVVEDGVACQPVPLLVELHRAVGNICTKPHELHAYNSQCDLLCFSLSLRRLPVKLTLSRYFL